MPAKIARSAPRPPFELPKVMVAVRTSLLSCRKAGKNANIHASPGVIWRIPAKSPQTNGICERFHKTALNEFYRVAFRKKVYRSIDELQADLDARIKEYNEARPHQGRWCFGKTPMQTFLEAMPMTKQTRIAA